MQPNQRRQPQVKTTRINTLNLADMKNFDHMSQKLTVLLLQHFLQPTMAVFPVWHMQQMDEYR